MLALAINPNNRIADAGFTYDAAGNLTAQPGTTYAYDAENRLTSTAGVTYTYDGDGRRLMKSTGKLYWYGAGSDVLLEGDPAQTFIYDEFIYFNGQRIARRVGYSGVSYFFSDHLGSSRIVTDSSTVVEDSDFYPFGAERVVVDTLNNNYKFTGQERDSESGLDYFIARHYGFTLGRFLQPDEFAGGPVDVFSSNDPLPPSPLPYALITNPQSLNKYSYAYNNPLLYIDPNGHDVKEYLLLVSGPNQVPNAPHPGIPDASILGEKVTTRGGYFVYNTQAVFDEGDNPADYKPLRSACILKLEGECAQIRTGDKEDPSKSQIANKDNSQFVFDAPGLGAVNI
ncbi:MAG: RHS repeat domain-containing protein, partial [Candidatus Acidiferrales bacterium]